MAKKAINKGDRDTKNGRFLPGHPGGPGRPKIPSELKEALSQVRKFQGEASLEAHHYYSECRSLSVGEIERIADSNNENGLRAMIFRSFAHTLHSGNPRDVKTHLENMCGVQARQQVELTGAEGEPLFPEQKLTEEQMIKIFKETERILNQKDNQSELAPETD